MLLSMLRERQPDLDDHVDAVSELSRCVATELRLNNEELDVLTRAAELHDVGKMAVPNEILHKPGPLTDGEWEIMRQHTIVGERILDGVPALAPVAEVVRATHKRYDGSGYPDGLAGEEIPITARIISVCDAYDAIRSDRTYDQGRSHPLAVLELRRCAGTQFDPEIADAFCRSIERTITAPDDAAPVEDLDRRAWVAAA